MSKYQSWLKQMDEQETQAAVFMSDQELNQSEPNKFDDLFETGERQYTDKEVLRMFFQGELRATPELIVYLERQFGNDFQRLREASV